MSLQEVQGAAGDLRAPTGKLLHRTADVLKILSIGKTTFYRLAAQGKLKIVKIGTATFVSDESIRAFVASLEQGAAQ